MATEITLCVEDDGSLKIRVEPNATPSKKAEHELDVNSIEEALQAIGQVAQEAVGGESQEQESAEPQSEQSPEEEGQEEAAMEQGYGPVGKAMSGKPKVM